jgi:hypothetical protein
LRTPVGDCPCLSLPAPPALDQQPDPPFYNSTNGTVPATFKLSNRRTDPDSAESYCNDVGGHLVQYTSQEEQNDVELFYIYGVGACLHGNIADAGLHVAALAACPASQAAV